MSTPFAATTAEPGCAEGPEIQQLQNQLAALRVQYMDKHPRIVALQETITRLEQQCAAEASVAGQWGQRVSDRRRPADSIEANPVYQNLKIQYNTAEVDLVEARAQLATSQSTVVQLRRDVDKITEVEAQLKQLNRDYDVVQGRHQELLKRWEELMAKERLDPVSDNVLFRRIEPPFALADPVGPKRPLLLGGVLAVALAAGLAVAFVLNQLHPVYFTRASLGRATAFPVLGSISMILDARGSRAPADASHRVGHRLPHAGARLRHSHSIRAAGVGLAASADRWGRCMSRIEEALKKIRRPALTAAGGREQALGYSTCEQEEGRGRYR